MRKIVFIFLLIFACTSCDMPFDSVMPFNGESPIIVVKEKIYNKNKNLSKYKMQGKGNGNDYVKHFYIIEYSDLFEVGDTVIFVNKNRENIDI